MVWRDPEFKNYNLMPGRNRMGPTFWDRWNQNWNPGRSTG